MSSDLTVEEQANVRGALRFIFRRCGSWDAVAKALRSKKGTIKPVAYGKPVTASLAIRLARLAKVPVDDVLCGRYPPANVCAHCGQRKDASEKLVVDFDVDLSAPLRKGVE